MKKLTFVINKAEITARCNEESIFTEADDLVQLGLNIYEASLLHVGNSDFEIALA